MHIPAVLLPRLIRSCYRRFLLQFAYQKVQGRQATTPKEPLALLELLTNLFGQHAPVRVPVNDSNWTTTELRAGFHLITGACKGRFWFWFGYTSDIYIYKYIFFWFFSFLFSVLSLIVSACLGVASLFDLFRYASGFWFLFTLLR